MNWELVISGLALLISGITALYSYFQGRKSNTLQEEQTDLQRRVVELEEQREEQRREATIKADVKAKVLYRSTAKGKKSYKLCIYNDGPGAAENVRIKIDEEPVTNCDFVLADEFEYKILAADAELKFPLALNFDSPSNWETTVLWDDKTGKDNKFETILTG